MSKLHRKHGLDSRHWKRLRRAILDASNWRCRTCGGYANEVDHTRALHHGGAPWDVANLQPLCRRCHRQKSISESLKPDPDREAWADYLREIAREQSFCKSATI